MIPVVRHKSSHPARSQVTLELPAQFSDFRLVSHVRCGDAPFHEAPFVVSSLSACALMCQDDIRCGSFSQAHDGQGGLYGCYLFDSSDACSTADHMFMSAIRDRSCAIAESSDVIKLECPHMAVIGAIVFASYGNPVGSCEHFSHGSCMSEHVREEVQSKCLGRRYCIIDVAALHRPACSLHSKPTLRVKVSCKGLHYCTLFANLFVVTALQHLLTSSWTASLSSGRRDIAHRMLWRCHHARLSSSPSWPT